MFCKNCGKEIREDTRFCSGCGAEQNSILVENNTPVNIQQPTVNLAQSQPKKKLSTGAIVGIVVAVIVVVVIAVSMGSRDDNENYIPTISPIEDSTYDFGFEDLPNVGTVPQKDTPIQANSNPAVQQINPPAVANDYASLLIKYGYADSENFFPGLNCNSYVVEDVVEGINMISIARYGYMNDKVSDIEYTYVFDIRGMTEQEAAQFEYETRTSYMNMPTSNVDGCCYTAFDFGDKYVAVTTVIEGLDNHETRQKLAAAGWSDFNILSSEYISMNVTDGMLLSGGWIKK